MKNQPNKFLLFFLIGMLAFLIGCTSAESAETDLASAEEPVANALPTATLRPVTEAQPLDEEIEEMAEPLVSTTFIQYTIDDTEVPEAESTLVRMEHGLYTTFTVSNLPPGYAYTLWWVIFNEPEKCSGGECGLDDGFIMEDERTIMRIDGEDQINWDQRAFIGMSAHRASGSIVDVNGFAEFKAHLPIGDTTEAVLKGEGLKDSFAAEVHLFIRSHGEIIEGKVHEQMNTPWGGCPEGWPKSPPCTEEMFAVHLPPTTVDQ